MSIFRPFLLERWTFFSSGGREKTKGSSSSSRDLMNDKPVSYIVADQPSLITLAKPQESPSLEEMNF